MHNLTLFKENSSFHILLVNNGSLSDTIEVGGPNVLITNLLSMEAAYYAVHVRVVGMRKQCLDLLRMTLKIASYPDAVLGKCVMKSRLILSKLDVGIGKGCKYPY